MANGNAALIASSLALLSFAVGCEVEHGEPPIPHLPLRAGWHRVSMPEVGTIDIPPVLEVQGEEFERLKRELRSRRGGRRTGFEEDIVLQQAGLNDGDPEASQQYVRIMVETKVGGEGDYARLGQRLSVPRQALADLDRQMKGQLESQGQEVIEWCSLSVESINGMPAFHWGYLRESPTNPPVTGEVYLFQNHDRVHRVTLACREAEKEFWWHHLQYALASLRITEIQ